jgi:hypothetical protein
LLGPDYSTSQGLSGLQVENILDSLNQNRVITYLYNNGILLGIFSKDSFLTKNEIIGYGPAGTLIQTGFNAGTVEGIKFNVTATNSETLGKDGTYPNGVPANIYVRNDTSNIINGQVIISSNLGIIVGDANQGQFQVQDGNLLIANIASDRQISMIVRKGVLPETAVRIEAAERKIKLYENYTDSEVLIGGKLIVEGDLEVNGDVVTVNTSTLVIENKSIELAVTDAPSDTIADGGGIILRGTDDHSLIWSLASKAWNSSEHVNLVSSDSVQNPEYKINGTTVLSATQCLVSDFPNLNQIGVQLSLTVDDLFFDSNIIKVNLENTDLILDINGTGSLNLDGKRITNLANPRSKPSIPGDPDLGLQDAASRDYVDQSLESRNLVLTLDVSDGISNAGIANLLNQIAPISEYRLGTRARILCTFAANSNSTFDINALTNPSLIQVNTPTGTAFVLNSVAFNPAVVPSQGISISRTIKIFERGPSSWGFVA